MASFYCDPKEFNCTSVCCKRINHPPFVTKKDMQAIAQYLQIPLTEVWEKYLTLYGTLHNDKFYLHFGLNYTPYCIFLNNDQCSIHSAKPLSCRFFPMEIDFKEDKLPCLRHPLPAEAIEQQKQELSRHLEDLLNTVSQLLDTNGVLPQIPKDEEVFNTLVSRSDFYYTKNPFHQKQYIFIRYYLQKRLQFAALTRSSLDLIVVSEYLYLIFFDQVFNKLNSMPIS